VSKEDAINKRLLHLTQRHTQNRISCLSKQISRIYFCIWWVHIYYIVYIC